MKLQRFATLLAAASLLATAVLAVNPDAEARIIDDPIGGYIEIPIAIVGCGQSGTASPDDLLGLDLPRSLSQTSPDWLRTDLSSCRPDEDPRAG